jgi:3-oxoacyl-[acyl-carrier-protein] synthase II
MSTAVCRTRIWQGTVYSKPAEVTGAGAIEAIACILAITKGIIPPTINHFADDPAFDPKLNLTFNKAQHREVKYALSNTFGFGGHNASVILKKFEE